MQLYRICLLYDAVTLIRRSRVARERKVVLVIRNRGAFESIEHLVFDESNRQSTERNAIESELLLSVSLLHAPAWVTAPVRVPSDGPPLDVRVAV